MNILVPMAGSGQRFVDAGYTEPKPFIDVLGKPMIQRVIENLGGPGAGEYIFVVRDYKHMHRIRNMFVWPREAPKFVVLHEPTAGAAVTALHAQEFIRNNDPLLIANSDQLVHEYYEDGIELPDHDVFVDGIIWTFDAQHPKWSYVASDNHGRVWGVAEKQVVSRRATCGIYWWKRGNDFVRAAEKMIAKNIRVNNEFYVAPTFNEAIMEGATVVEATVSEMWGLGTPEDLRAYENAHRSTS